MELYQLRAFVQVARIGNLTQAAERLHISPSALSTQIKNLEAELEIPLFIRQPRGMVLTEEGKVLCTYARAVIEKAESFAHQSRRLRRRPATILRIGLNAAPEFLKISRIAETPAKTMPGAAIRYVKSDTLDTPRMLTQGIIDIGFVFGVDLDREIHIDFLVQVDFHVVIPRRLLPPGLEPGWRAVVRMPWIWVEKKVACHAAFQKELDARQLAVNTVSYAVDDSITQELIREGQGLALMRSDDAQRLVAEGCASIWRQGTVKVPLGMACLVQNGNDPIVRTARDIIVGLWER
jgi:DNA-binding transcriptional LysR family regulator